MKLRQKKGVLVAMSGGVDSSVAAALLKKQGFFVVGVFMKFWNDDLNDAPNHYLIRANKGIAVEGLRFKSTEKENKCCSGDAYEAAKGVCAKLDIPFQTLNVQEKFKKEVVDYFLNEYKAGRTPNPCIRCNEKIKFQILLEMAKKWGMDYVATGHYARKHEIKIKNPELRTPFFKLLAAKDKEKDQSYFLYNLTQKQLRHILFPVGDYTKEEVRRLAKKWRLPTAERPESFEVCFIPDKRTADFLARHLKMKPGKIVDEEGHKIGEHRGLPFYTIGQRHGLNIFRSSGPYYVAAKNPAKNELVVTNNPRSSLLCRKELIAERVNWIPGVEPKLPLKILARIRYRQPLQSCWINKPEIRNLKFDTIKVIFNKPQKAITPGQSVVFYSFRKASTREDRDREVLGGGIII